MSSEVALQSTPNGVLTDQFGNVLAGRQVGVYLRDTTTPVTVYSDAGLTTPLTQPLTVGADGSIPGYVDSATGAIDYVDVATGTRRQGYFGLPSGLATWLLPSGSDDTVAINLANSVGQALGAGTFLISGAITCPYGQGQAYTTIRATAAAACIQDGPALPAAPSNALPQRAGAFTFDANNVATGGATKCLIWINRVNWHYEPFHTTNEPVDVDALVVGGQNCEISKPEVNAQGQGFCLAFDNGAGGNEITTPRLGGGNHIDFRETVGTNGYGVPQQNVIDNWTGDNPAGSGFATTYSVRHRAGHMNEIRDSAWIHRAAAAGIKFESNAGTTYLNGRSGYTGGLYANGQLILTGKIKFEGAGEGVLGGEGQSFAWSDFSSDGASAAGAMADVVAMWCMGVLNIAGVDREFKWGSTTPVVGVSCSLYRQPTASTRPLWTASGTGALADANGLWRLLSTNTWAFGGLPDTTITDKLQVKTGGMRVTQNGAGQKLWSGGSGLNTWLSVGRTAEELQIGVAGGPGNYFADTVTGDLAVRAYANHIRLGVASGGQNPADNAEFVISDGSMTAQAKIIGVHDAYRELPSEWGLGLVLASASVAGTYLPSGAVVGAAGTAKSAFYLDPADFPAIAGTTKVLRVRGIAVTNAVAPAINYTFGLYPVATWGGASGATPTVATVGTVTATAPAITTPAASGPAVAVGSDTTFPSAGYYVLAVVLSGTQATNAVVVVRASLEMRWS